MMEPPFHVNGWEEWQSYRSDRGQPPWIKIHRRLLRNEKWIGLSDSERGQLISLWLLAADHGGDIVATIPTIQKICFMSEPINMNKFIDLEFVRHDGVKVASRWRQGGVSEESRVEESRVEETVNGSREPTRAAPRIVDTQLVETMKTNPAYSDLDIDAELGKCQAWCLVNTKSEQPSRKRFVNWLNKAYGGRSTSAPRHSCEASVITGDKMGKCGNDGTKYNDKYLCQEHIESRRAKHAGQS